MCLYIRIHKKTIMHLYGHSTYLPTHLSIYPSLYVYVYTFHTQPLQKVQHRAHTTVPNALSRKPHLKQSLRDWRSGGLPSQGPADSARQRLGVQSKQVSVHGSAKLGESKPRTQRVQLPEDGGILSHISIFWILGLIHVLNSQIFGPCFLQLGRL